MSSIILKDRVDFLYGFSVRVDDENPGDYPVFGSNGITGYINTYKIKGPGIIIGRKGTVGAVNFSKDNFTPTDTSYYLSLKDGRKDDLRFWYYYLKLLGLNKLNTHSSVPGLSREIAYFINVNPPDICIQKRIAAVLSTIDAKIELNNRINAELEAVAKTLYDYWFVQFDFPDKSGKPYKTSGGKMVWNKELKREIPEGWDCGSLSDLGNIVGGSTPSTDDPDNFAADGTPWITPKDLSNSNSYKFISRGELGVTAQGIKSASLKACPNGTVLLSSRAPIGYMSIARNPVTTNQGFKSFIPHKDYPSQFIYYTIKNSMKTIVQYASGSTFKEISGSVLKTVKICLPKGAVVYSYTQTVSSIFERQDLLEQENQHLSSLRDWLLPMLMNGQVKVN